MSQPPDFWIVRAGTVRPARTTPRGIEELRQEAGALRWRLVPYNAGTLQQFETPEAAHRWAARLARAKGRVA
ncbi:MAG: hypothetical protein N2688_00065 [Burkholderiaceae bacterium]|nr:hypothetical protein [Burkholderiaceae bacterium]